MRTEPRFAQGDYRCVLIVARFQPHREIRRDEVAQRIVRQFLVEVRICHVSRRLHHDRVAVRGAARDGFGADSARSTAAIFDDELLAQLF
jgi:hypothetical protein